MDYEKRYKEALSRARVINPGTKDYNIVTTIFPELKEKEDERIKNNIIKLLRFVRDTYHQYFDECNEAIEWIEKKHPKFKVGDWVVFNTGGIYQVERIENYQYTLRYTLGGSMPLPFSSESLIRPWTIQDAMAGDILCYNDEIFILKYFVISSRVAYYCCFDDKTFISNSVYFLSKEEFNKIRPATKEQRAFLFQKMKEAGYKWNDTRKKLILTLNR